jgi:hypothetical protein
MVFYLHPMLLDVSSYSGSKCQEPLQFVPGLNCEKDSRLS